MEPEGAGLVIVDKPAGMTSHDVVSRCRRAMKTRRVGHAGTLDPMATGVLIVGIERATKLLGHLALTTKAYDATIRLGAATTTDDAEGGVVSSASAAGVDEAAVLAGVAELTGDIAQRPSSVSAIKVDGKRAHQLVREGVEVDLPARPVTVSEFTVSAFRRAGAFLDVDVSVECSSGTYVRALARDLGAGLGVGGHLTALRRTRVGPYDLSHAVTLESLAESPRLSYGIDDAVAAGFRVRPVTADQAVDLSLGRWLEPVGIDGVYAAVDTDGRAIALLQESGRRAASVFVVRPAV
ncbi:tRNA pseudouridine(55) synthase TruB [Tsukamurella sp. 8F]|uniref:tRNA pseudouridine(55) synthase TruB n=1 Tax=unclassified Tsukamurella TaxID=2633480 RepID=UPI0023B98493|nr:MULTISPECIES: tRNA pseudouridine(55) synthase TruB [unclassified Tsukamurella]MDF0532040.1 tRNA pseudouridine(55) synthase TruB [Tsukamurella sp. 8J]MDF0587529.1 tRNA pseudouridine(55) synthase TruB [Tsukamurella sp. 8F]